MEQPPLGQLPPVRTQRQQSLEPGADTPARAETPFNPWVLGLASVLFDVDKGQTLQDIWPPDVLSEEDRSAVAFHAFPDSLSMELCLTRNAIKDSSFSFRIRREQQQQQQQLASSSSPPQPDFLYGYVFCRQRQDESLRRGGEQASVVVLAMQPLGSVLLPLSQAAGHAFFSEGALALAAVYNHVLMWPPPMPGGRMCLPVGPGSVINARLPHFSTLPPPQPAIDPALQATLTRRASRTISLKAGFSPRLGSRRASQELHQQQQQQAGSEVAAAAAGGAGVTSPAGGSQEQQQAERAGSVEGSGGSFSGERPGSRLSRQDLSTGAGSNSSSSLAPESASGTQAAVNSSGSGGADSSSGNGAGCYEWLTAALGQHWRDETPFPEVEPALVLAPLLRDLWQLWQLLVTAQPLMVVGLHPADTSAAVAALAALIAPLPYAADFRPYFTIHDPDFIALAAGRLPKRTRYQEVLPAAAQQEQQPSEQAASLAAAAAGDGGGQAPGQAAAAEAGKEQQEQQAGSAAASKERTARAAAAAAAAAALAGDLPVLLGVTNVFFVKALPKWPNVVAVSRREPTSAAASSSRSSSPSKVAASSEGGAAAAGNEAAGGTAAAAALSAGGAGVAGGGGSVSTGGSPVPPAASGRFGSGLFSSTAAAAVRALQRRHQGPQHLLSHFAPHLWTCGQHVQYIKPDHALLSKSRAAIEPAVGPSPAAAAAAAAASASGGSLAAAVGAPAATAAARLRRHFAELTAGLLAPFDCYFTPGPDGTVPAWRPEAFLASLDPAALPPALTARLWGNADTAARTLFGGFIESPHFAFWFQQRRAPVLHLVRPPAEEDDEDEDGFARVAPGDGDLSDAGVNSQDDDDDGGGDEVERVQQLLSAETALSTAWQQQAQQGEQGEEQQQGLRDLQLRFAVAFCQLPHDLAVQLVTSPQRQELLAAAAEAATSSSDTAAVAVGERLQALLADLLLAAAAQT